MIASVNQALTTSMTRALHHVYALILLVDSGDFIFVKAIPVKLGLLISLRRENYVSIFQSSNYISTMQQRTKIHI